jgi:hypothetical protein
MGFDFHELGDQDVVVSKRDSFPFVASVADRIVIMEEDVRILYKLSFKWKKNIKKLKVNKIVLVVEVQRSGVIKENEGRPKLILMDPLPRLHSRKR